MNKRRFPPLGPRSHGGANRQRGVVLLFSLIALVILLIVAVALLRSFQTSLFTAGNIAFKRDLQNQSERAVAAVLPVFKTGALATSAARAANVAASNYSAQMLTTNAQGIPLILLASDTTFAATWTAADITPATDATLPANQVKSIRYIVDRLCSVTGNESTLGSTQCALGDNPTPDGSSSMNLQAAERIGVSASNPAAALQSVVYRISIRVTGPRDTQSFFQSTFSVPS